MARIRRFPHKMDLSLREFPDFPKRDDMQNSIHLHQDAHMNILSYHLGNEDTTFVFGDTPISPTSRNPSDIRIADLIVSFNCNPDRIIEQWGYAIDEQRKPPDWVLNVAPILTDFNSDRGTLNANLRDYTDKRRDYERYGVTEYWRLDSTGGDYYDATLAGDRLVDGKYQPIPIEWLDDNRCRGYSEALGLSLCWEYGKWRWHNPRANAYLPTYDELYDFVAHELAQTRVTIGGGYLATYYEIAGLAMQILEIKIQAEEEALQQSQPADHE